jgi:DNA-binding transcriptional LysR family regulator
VLDPRRLAVLRAFAAEKTIAGAAGVLSFTPSAVSQQLSQLQREAGVPLLRKVGRRLELTDAGRLLVDRAGEILERLEAVQAELAADAGLVQGTVRVAAFETAGIALAVPALEALEAQHPALRVELSELEAEVSLPLLARGGLDLVIAEEYDHAPRAHVSGVHREALAPDELVLALPPAHPAAATERPVALAALAGDSWATAREGTAYAAEVARICRSAGGFEPQVRHRVNDLGLLLALVASSRAVALVPALGHPGREPGIALRAVAEGPLRRGLFVAVRESDRLRPATAAVAAAVRAVRAGDASEQRPRPELPLHP